VSKAAITRPPEPEVNAPVPVAEFAEREVIGAILEDSLLLDGLSLEPDDFFALDTRRVFEAIQSLVSAQLPVDYITVADRLGNSQEDYVSLASMIGGAVTVRSHIEAYARILRNKSKLRRLLRMAGWLCDACKHPQADAGELVKEITRQCEFPEGGPF